MTMKLTLTALVLATLVAAPSQLYAETANPTKEAPASQEYYCPSDPVTCYLVEKLNIEFECVDDPLTCWFGMYRDPDKRRVSPKNQGW